MSGGWPQATRALLSPFLHGAFSNFDRSRCSRSVLSTIKLRTHKTLRFWTGVAAEHIKSDNAELSKRQLVAQILREYERRGHALRCLNKRGRIVWKASPRFLSMLSDAERDARDDMAESP